MSDLPASARVVIIGGGIVGCSTAYHLGAMGAGEVLLLERHRLSSGSTWHAAGLVGQLRTNANVTQLLGYSVELYDRLEAETGLATGWKRNGGLRLACTAERWTEVKRQATTARSFGLDMHLLTPREAQELWPLMTVDDVVGAALLPTDGQASPSDLVQALARGARQKGVAIREGVRVTGIRVEAGRVTGVETDQGFVACDKAVCCAGQWSRVLGRMAGVNVPLVSVQHQYLITERIDGVTPGLPTLRDPDRLTYYKEEVGGLVMGGYEPNPKPWAERGIPEGFAFQLLDGDWDHFEPIMELALGRVPALQQAGVRQFINGPESFTPDGNFILGEAPEVDGFFVGAGFNAFGIASGGGAGMALAEWVATGAPPTTSGRSTSVASGAITARRPGCGPARSRPMPSITRWPGRARNTPRAGRYGARRSTTGSRRKARSSARSSAGSGRTGSPDRARRRATSTASNGRTGSRRSGASTAPAGRRPRSSTRPRSRSS
jgi:sarcosine dehydrogenase